MDGAVHAPQRAPRPVLGRPRRRQGHLVRPRGLVAIGYDLHGTRGKTANARRRIDRDPTTIDVLNAWRAWQTIERRSVGIEPSARMFADGRGEAIHPHAISQTFERIAGAPVCA